MLVDFGGGTLGVSIVKWDDNIHEVVATSGDHYLGGEDFDNRMVKYLMADFKRKTGLDISGEYKCVHILLLFNHVWQKKERLHWLTPCHGQTILQLNSEYFFTNSECYPLTGTQ